jgi:hypothetical protein
MSKHITDRNAYAPAILAYIKDRFRESNTDDAIYINCPITNRVGYEIYPEDGLQPVGYYIAINGEVNERDPLLNNIASLDDAKAEIAVRIGISVSIAQNQVDNYLCIANQEAVAA